VPTTVDSEVLAEVVSRLRHARGIVTMVRHHAAAIPT
jgi:hypothetical protein